MSSPSFDLTKFKKKSESTTSNSVTTKRKFVADNASVPDIVPYAQAFLRGISGFAPGGFIGAGAGLVGEGLAQSIGSEPYNFPLMGTQAALGTIPFGKAASIGRGMMKGGLMGGGGALATQQATEGLHIPTGQDLGGIALGTALGAAGGGLTAKMDLSKFKVKSNSRTPAADAVVEGIKPPSISDPFGTKIKPNRREFFDRVLGNPDKRAQSKYWQIAKELESEALPDITDPNWNNAALVASNKFERLMKEAGITDRMGMIFSKEQFRAMDHQERLNFGKNIKSFIDDFKARFNSTQGEYPEITLPAPKPLDPTIAEPNIPHMKRDMRTRPKNPIIMSDDREAGRRIMEQILAESKASKIPDIDVQSLGIPKTKQGTIDLSAPGRTGKDTPGSTIISWLNASKATAASADLSAPLRQGIFLIGRKAWWNAWKPMIQSLKEGNYDRINTEIAAHPRFKQATDAGVKITTTDTIGNAEEQFASKIAESIPILGKYLIKPSERAYTTFLNKLRIDLFNDLATKAERLKIPTPEKNIANYINAATGRGSMGLTVGGSSKTLEAAAPLLNTAFFSPRFIASRIQLLNPVSYVKMDPFTRKEAMRDLATLTSVAGTALGLAKMNGFEVSMDPTDTDFGKIKNGNLRVDMLGGFGQYIRFFAQTVKGLTTEETGPDPKRFIESKLSPTARIITDMISGKDYFGKEISIPKSVIQNAAPMIGRDIYELWKEDPNLVPLAGLSMFGLPTQSYGEKTTQKGTPSGIPRIRLPRAN